MPRMWAMWGVLGICISMLGCQGSTPAGKPDRTTGTPPGDEQTEGAEPGKNPAVKPQLTVLDGVESFEGNWVLAPSIQGAGRFIWLLRLSKDEAGKWTIEDLANVPEMGTVSGVDVKIADNQIRLDAQIRQEVKTEDAKPQVKTAKLSFEGTLRDGKVLGNVVMGEPDVTRPGRLIPTDVESLAEYAAYLPEEGMGPFEEALRKPDPAHGLWKVAQSIPRSALALDVYATLFSQMEKWNFTEDEARSAAKDFTDAVEPWGTRMQAQMEIDAGLNLARVRKFIGLAEEFLDAGESHAPKESQLAEMKLKAGRINVRIARGLLAINGKDSEAAAAAYADLQQLLTDQPLHAEILLALAEHARRTQQIDTAINYYLLLVGLPSMERMALQSRLGVPADDQIPHTALKTLWQEKHGSLEGLDAALGEAYDREIEVILGKIRTDATAMPAADAGNRVLLVEFFTGASCEPCVAPDIALAGVLKDVPLTEVIQLTYHQHMPAPDPLTSIDGEARGKFYDLQGTPHVRMNGAPIGQIGGYFLPPHIEQNYHAFRAPIDFFLKLSTDVKIEPTAEVVDGQLNVKVAVTGVPDDLISKVRLRVAIAEDQVNYVAPNGIRHHHMVVRMLLGGTGGKAANKDQVLEYAIKLPLAQVKAQQLGYLMQFEHGRRTKFAEKPLDMKPLHLVAFVQNDATKEILQAAATPVLGELVYPEFTPPEEPAEEPAKTESKAPAEKPAEDAAAETSGAEKATPEK